MVDAIHGGFAFGHQAREHQGRRSAQIRGHHGATGEFRGARDDGRAAINTKIGAEPLQFHGVLKAILEDGFLDDADAVGLGHHGHGLGLQIRGKGREGRGSDVAGAELLRGLPLDAQLLAIGPFPLGDETSHALQQINERPQIIGPDALQHHVATRDGHGAKVRASLDAIGNRGVRGSMQGIHALDGERRCPHAFDARAHLVEQLREIADLRLHGGIPQDGSALGQRRREQRIFGGADAHFFKRMINGLKPPAWNLGFDIALHDLNVRAHAGEGFEMQIDGSGTDGAAAGQGNRGMAKTSQQRPQHQDAGAHGLHQFVGRLHLAAFQIRRSYHGCVLQTVLVRGALHGAT